MAKLLSRNAIAIAIALFVSADAFSQVPVSDLSSGIVEPDPARLERPGIESRLTILERQVKNRSQMQHQLQQKLDDMQYEIDELRGAVEVHTNQLKKVLERQRELYLEIDKRVESLKQSADAVPLNASPDTKVAEQSNGATSTSVDESSLLGESEAYDQAVNLILKSREYDKAIPEFQRFLARFPDSEYAPNAHYWLGQLLFNKQEWSSAKQEFEKVINRFSDSTKRPDAMLKLGVIAQQQGQQSQAKSWFERIIAEYPNSSVRKLAEARL